LLVFQCTLIPIGTQSAGLVGNLKDAIILAACQASEILPFNPRLPADIFTSCLTTPIKMALRWHALFLSCLQQVFVLTELCRYLQRSPLLLGVTAEMIDAVPGAHVDRRTPAGELNWILTAITDTIAWNTLPPGLHIGFFVCHAMSSSDFFSRFLCVYFRAQNCFKNCSGRICWWRR
jgi:regulator-associated protein of mTOR